MRVIHAPATRLHEPRGELSGGLLVPPFENPRRAEIILDAIARRQNLGPLEEPPDFGLEPILRVHDPDYVEFLGRAWAAWRATGAAGDAIPINWPARRMTARRPDTILGQLGFHALAADSAIGPQTFQAARAAANVALQGMARLLKGEAGVFALCRPPGHHASRDQYGGYCFLNNAAIAAQYARDHGAARVAVLDVDFHHGNGTQDIFYGRDDVLFVSIHGDPSQNFPFFSGYADESGQGAGEGFTLNLPLPRGADWALWRAALERALARIEVFAPDILVISLGLDAFIGDPISFFRLTSEDFSRLGAAIATLNRPTLFVLEGGYAIADLGVNLCAVLGGFDGG